LADRLGRFSLSPSQHQSPFSAGDLDAGLQGNPDFWFSLSTRTEHAPCSKILQHYQPSSRKCALEDLNPWSWQHPPPGNFRDLVIAPETTPWDGAVVYIHGQALLGKIIFVTSEAPTMSGTGNVCDLFSKLVFMATFIHQTPSIILGESSVCVCAVRVWHFWV
jgi:hypothetical protein